MTALRIAIVAVMLTPLSAHASGFDVRHYDLTVKPDFTRKLLMIEAALRISNPGGAKVFDFYLNERYSEVSAETDKGQRLEMRRAGGGIEISIPDAPRRFVLRIRASGALGDSGDERRPVIGDDDLFLLWSDWWYPAHADDWATVTTRVVLPRAYLAIAPGVLSQTRPAANTVEYTFAKRQPAINFSVFADTRWRRAERVVNGVRMQTLLDPESEPYRDRIFAASADVIRYFTELHGFRPFDVFSFVSIRRIYARRAFTDFIGYEPSYLAKEMARTGYDAHETSLIWWGYAAHGSGPGSYQWTEGLGDYVEAMYAEARGTPLSPNFPRFRDLYLATAATEDVTYDKLRGNTPQKIVHGKYPWTMQVLRRAIGDEAFRAGIRRLFSEYRYRAFTLDQFIATFEAASLQPLAWWRRDWLERRGVPHIEMKATTAPVDENGKRAYAVECELRYAGEIYRLPLDVGIKTAKGIVIRPVVFAEPQQSFKFTIEDQPLAVVIDPNSQLLLKQRPTVPLE